MLIPKFYLLNDEFYIDFETISFDPARDIGALAAYILTNSPRFTKTKQKAVHQIIKVYCSRVKDVVTPRQISNYLWQELGEIAARRPGEQEEILKFCLVNQKEWTS